MSKYVYMFGGGTAELQLIESDDPRIAGLDTQRVAEDRRAAVRCWSEPHHLRRQTDATVVLVVRDVVQRDMDAQSAPLALRAVPPRGNSPFGRPCRLMPAPESRD